MKLKIKSVLKSTYSNFECFDDQQIMFRSGNTLCIKEIGKPDGQFICLSKGMDNLYYFKPTTNKKAVFTAQKSDNLVEVAQYNLKGERKAISLTDQSPFFAEIDSVQLLVDEYDNNLVYGSAKSKDSACVFLADFSKGRILCTGYMALFEDIKVDSRENMTLSICGHNGNCNFVKSLKYTSGSWQVEDTFYKKIHNGVVLQHQILFGGRMLFATRQSLYIFMDTELVQTVNLMETDNKFICDLLKIPKGILVRLSNDCIKIFVQDNDETTMLCKGDLSISLNSDDRIQKMQISSNNQQVIIRTLKNNLYRWKCQNIDRQPGSSEANFNLVESSCNNQKFGNISLSTGQKYCLLSGPKVVTLWSVQKNEFVLSSEFANSTEPQKKVVFACAINPDGNSFMLAFEDRIKIYKILLTKFKSYAEFQIKRCQNIIYSHGGQLVACRFGKGVNSCLSILNTLRLVELGTLKIQSEPRQIVWNELDDEILVSTQNNSLQYFNIGESIRTHTIKFDNQISYIRIDYKMRKVLVSSTDKITVVEDGKIIEVIQPAIPNFDYVFPLYGIYLAASTTGVLYWSTTPRFQTFQEYPLFTKSKFEIISRSGYLLAYSSLQDVTILECIRPDYIPKKSAASEIVSVEHQQIIDFFDKVKTIEASFDKLQDSTQAKLEEEKVHYQSALKLLQDHFKEEIAFLNQKYSDITLEKLKQDRATEKIFENLQSGQTKNVNELQKMYERKLAIEREKTMNLQQLNLQQKLTYEKIIYQLESRYHRDVSIVREQYAKNFKMEAGKAEEVKKHHLEQKYRLEARLMNLEEQNEITLGTVQLNKDSIIQNMRAKHQRLEEMNETLQIKVHNQQISLEELNVNHQQNDRDLKRLNFKLQENVNRIRILESESRRKDEMLQERNQVITEQAHKIEELEKAKYVLSFRATQIRKQLEPKQTLTDKLRSELIKLDEQFKQEKRKNFDMRQKIDKLQKLNQQSKKQITELKQSTKHKQRIHDDLCSEIFAIVNTTDFSDWNNAIIKIYQSYIKEDKFKTRTVNKQKEEMSEEMNRHLNHVEQSLIQAAKGNQKMIKAKEKDITRKMKENSELLYAINQMKKSEKEKNDLAAAALQKMKNQATKIQNMDSNRNSTRAHTANTGGITKRVVASRQAFSRQKESFLEFHDIESARQHNVKSRSRNRISSAHKTILYQGVKREQSGKIVDMAKELQISRNTIKRQGLIIEELNQRLFALPEV